ncbi:MAG TPA: 4-hydroxy-tetrahydrodipicolinate reductase [Firmicutes bacterium]|nr:4-hydroxy-tetrahydrodipicolinate reductase [Bacillales bacterium]HJA40548.1 4-hydroxy-tetrahydrodipicolinate reductase [Bacillota bacterium]
MGTIKIALAGPRGKMGQEAIKAIFQEENLEIVAWIDRVIDANFVSQVEHIYGVKLPVYVDAALCFQKEAVDVLIDLTTPEIGKVHTQIAVDNGVRPVVGTTGFTSEDLKELQKTCEKKQMGCIIAPNFAIGAVLLMKFAQIAVKYMPYAEIIELHHDGKKDAPSGTALKTAQLMEAAGNPAQNQNHMFPAQGLNAHGYNIHSVRLPGMVAHQEVIFGGDGQTLTLRHDSFNRASFMSGLIMCVNKIMDLHTLVYGLENLLDDEA